MTYRKIYPSSSIKSIVQFFWEFEGDFCDSIPYEHSVTASIYPKLAFQYEGRMTQNNGQNQLFKSGFQCQTNSFHQISACQKTGIFGVYFHSYAIPLLFNIPADRLTNYNIEISDLLGKEGEEVEERIMLCNSLKERIQIITEFIERKLKNVLTESKNIISAVNYIISSKGIIDIPELIESHFLSQRQFERKFKELTGFSPKMFSRIVRFEECISKAVSGRQSLTELTFASGYYDQSHMIKDFREFSGNSPKSYFSEDLSIFFD